MLLSTDALGAMHASGGVPFACAYSIRKVIRRKRHKEIVVTVHYDIGATEIVSVCVARGVVGGAYTVQALYTQQIRRLEEFAACRCSAQWLG